MITVTDLLKQYNIDELIAFANEYYKSNEGPRLLRKPFILSDVIHLLCECAYLVYGLGIAPGDKVLDFGCGTGWASRILNTCGCDVVGVDISDTALLQAQTLSERWRKVFTSEVDELPPLTFLRFDGLHLDLNDGSVDKIFVLDAFHHVPHQDAVLREFVRVLRPGGIVGFAEPGPHHSAAPDSQLEMKIHKIIENDIVLSEIYDLARKVGFTELTTCLSPLLPMILRYEDSITFPHSQSIVAAFIRATELRIANFPIFFLRKAGVAPLDSRRIEGLSGHIKLLSQAVIRGKSDSDLTIRLRVKNVGKAVWLPSSGTPGSVNVGIIIDKEGSSKQLRAHLSSEVMRPGAQCDVVVTIPSLKQGDYNIELDLVAEHVSWFRSLGVTGVTVNALIR
jgi:SAM-dependent methyltransferase